MSSQSRNSCSNIPGNSMWPWSSENKHLKKSKDIGSIWEIGPVHKEVLKHAAQAGSAMRALSQG